MLAGCQYESEYVESLERGDRSGKVYMQIIDGAIRQNDSARLSCVPNGVSQGIVDVHSLGIFQLRQQIVPR